MKPEVRKTPSLVGVPSWIRIAFDTAVYWTSRSSLHASGEEGS